MFLWVAFLVAMISGAVLLVRALWDRAGGPGRGDGPENGQRTGAVAILEERYARGEIDRNEFEERRRMLDAVARDETR